MTDHPPERTALGPARLPAGLIGMLALLALTELTIARLDRRWQTPVFEYYRFTGRALESDSAKADVLVIGDSLLKFGVLPRVLEDRLGRRAFNLAHIGGQAPDTFFTLRRALARGARPAAVVLDFKPNMVQGSPLNRPAETVELRSLFDCLDLAWQAGAGSYFAGQLAAKLLPTLKYREPLRGEILAALKGQTRPGRAHAEWLRRNYAVNLGAFVAARKPGAKDVPEHWDEKSYLTPVFFGDPVNTAYIRRTLALAAAHRIPVYWLIPPVIPRVQAKREALGVDLAYTAFVSSFVARYPNLTVVDGRRAAYDGSQFVDAAHLDRHGASVFSLALAEVLRRGPGGPAWVELPRYREPASLPELEDETQSRLALTPPDPSTARR